MRQRRRSLPNFCPRVVREWQKHSWTVFSRATVLKCRQPKTLPPHPPPRQAIVVASHHRSDGDNWGPLPHASALWSSAGEEGEGLRTTTIRPCRPPQRDRLRLQWRPKTIQLSGRGGDDDTIDDRINNQQMTQSGGAGGASQDAKVDLKLLIVAIILIYCLLETINVLFFLFLSIFNKLIIFRPS